MANATYDVIVIGSGPGGYETAIRASQLGLNAAIVEKDKLGGVCLNIGCIPTTASRTSAEVASMTAHLADYGLTLDGTITPDFAAVVKRSRGVADKMNKGVEFLMKKNKIDVIMGKATLLGDGKIKMEPSETMDGDTVGENTEVSAQHIVVATGARARELPSLLIDGQKIIAYQEAMLQTERPDSMVIVGAGAIGVEFAYIYHNMGTEVTIVELLDRMVPVEDKDVSKELSRAFKKMGIKVMTSAAVENVDTSSDKCIVTIMTKKGEETKEVDQVLSAVGVVGNVENLGLEALGIEHERSAIKVDEFFRTNVPGIYAIGDVAGEPMLAHKATHEGSIAVEVLLGKAAEFDKRAIPAVVFTDPEIAWAGLTEDDAKKSGREIKVAMYPWAASGKAQAMGRTEGMTKWIIDPDSERVLGCGIVGPDAGALISEAVVAIEMGCVVRDITESVHPHPTLSETLMNAGEVFFGTATEIYKPRR